MINQKIAEDNCILRAQVGSKAHGLNIEGTDDTDEMGICIPPPEYVIGLKPFEQWVYRTQPEGVRSGPGDLDLTIYSLKKYVKLAAGGNPSILMLLFLPSYQFKHYLAEDLIKHREWFISKRALKAYLNYMIAQKERLFGERGQKRVNRPELVEEFGFDVKYAMHVIRLGLQGQELAKTHNISLPMNEVDKGCCLAIRKGRWSLIEIRQYYESLRTKLEYEIDEGDLPDEPNHNRIDNWLVDVHQEYWRL